MESSEESADGFAHGAVTSVPRHAMHALFRLKPVCKLWCRNCCALLCVRAMSAVLLADANVQLYSTDVEPLRCARHAGAAGRPLRVLRADAGAGARAARPRTMPSRAAGAASATFTAAPATASWATTSRDRAAPV